MEKSENETNEVVDIETNASSNNSVSVSMYQTEEQAEADLCKYMPEHFKLKNFTPHAVVIETENVVFKDDDSPDGKKPFKFIYPPHETSIRAKEFPLQRVGDAPFMFKVFEPPAYEKLIGFPFSKETPEEHEDIIVSTVVAENIPEWYTGNVFVPNTGPGYCKRNASGQIESVDSLFQYKKRKVGTE